MQTLGMCSASRSKRRAAVGFSQKDQRGHGNRSQARENSGADAQWVVCPHLFYLCLRHHYSQTEHLSLDSRPNEVQSIRTMTRPMVAVETQASAQPKGCLQRKHRTLLVRRYLQQVVWVAPGLAVIAHDDALRAVPGRHALHGLSANGTRIGFPCAVRGTGRPERIPSGPGNPSYGQSTY